MPVLHKFRVLNKMAAMSHESVVMQQVFCALSAAQLNQSTSRINVLGRSSFPVENEERKLQLNVLIDERTRICISCLRKLKKKKALEENLTAISDEIVRTFRGSNRPIDFVPFSVTCSTPTKLGNLLLVLVWIFLLHARCGHHFKLRRHQCSPCGPNRLNLVSGLVVLLDIVENTK